MEAIAHLWESLKPFLPTLSAMGAFIIGWLGIRFAAQRTRKRFEIREFMSQVNFSVNYIDDDGQLLMRTLAEVPTIEIWANEYGVKLVEQASEKTTLENPFVILDKQEYQDLINRALLNVLSERFAEAYLARALGMPVKTSTFIFGLTRERYPEIRTVKLRVLLIDERLLHERFTPERIGEIQTKNPYYVARLETLQIMHRVSLNGRDGKVQPLGHVELGLPV